MSKVGEGRDGEGVQGVPPEVKNAVPVLIKWRDIVTNPNWTTDANLDPLIVQDLGWFIEDDNPDRVVIGHGLAEDGQIRMVTSFPREAIVEMTILRSGNGTQAETREEQAGLPDS